MSRSPRPGGRYRLLRGGVAARMGDGWIAPPAAWTDSIRAKKESNIARMATRLGKNSVPMDYHSALRVLRDVIKERPDAILVNEARTRSIRRAG